LIRALDGYIDMSEKYKHLEIDDAKAAPAPEDVAAIEALLGRPLPRDFLDFLSVANGAQLEYCVRIPPGDEIVSFYDVFLAGQNEPGQHYSTFIQEIEMEREQREIPKEFLPFASDGSHAVVYLDLTPKGNGRVIASVQGYVWTGGQDDGYVVLAPGFAEYIEILFTCED
jgi:hypothetical protein